MKKPFVIMTVLSVVLLVFIAFVILNVNNTKHNEALSNYKWIRYESEMNVFVTRYNNNRGVGKLTSFQNENFLIPMAWENSAKRHLIASYLKIGDSIVKEKDSDTLFVIRNSGTKAFVLDKECKIPD